MTDHIQQTSSSLAHPRFDSSTRQITSGGQVSRPEKGKDDDKSRLTCGHKGCTKSFIRQGDLNRHSRKHQPEAANHHCPQAGCKYYEDKGFYRNDKLLSHCKTVHKLTPSEVEHMCRKRKHDRIEELEPGLCTRRVTEMNALETQYGYVSDMSCECWYLSTNEIKRKASSSH